MKNFRFLNHAFFKHFTFLIGLIFASYLFIFNVFGPNLNYAPGDLGDARFNIYLLEHAHQSFFIDRDVLMNYWDAPFMVPEKEVISYSDNLLGTFSIFSLFRLVGYDVYRSFQLWVITISILNFLSAYLFLFYLFKKSLPATIGAFIFAFSIAIASQLAHAQTFPRFPIPFIVWMSLIFFQKKSAKYFLILVFLIVYQFYCGIYLGFLTVVPTVILLIIGVFINWNTFKRKLLNLRYILAISSSFILGLFALFPLMEPYWRRSQQMNGRSFEEIVNSIPTIKSYLLYSSSSYFWQYRINVDDLPSFWNHAISPGYFTLFLTLFCVVFFFRKIVSKKLRMLTPLGMLGLTGLISFLLFFRIEDFSLYRLVFEIPGYSSMRAIQRIINFQLLFFGIAVAFCIHILLRSSMSVFPKFLTISFAILLLLADNFIDAEGTSRRSISEFRAREIYLTKKLSHLEEGTVFSYEPKNVGDNPHLFHLDAMLVAQKLNLKTLNGYSATSPSGYDAYWRNPQQESRYIWLQENVYPPFDIYVVE